MPEGIRPRTPSARVGLGNFTSDHPTGSPSDESPPLSRIESHDRGHARLQHFTGGQHA